MIQKQTQDRILRLCKVLFVLYLIVLIYLLFFFEMRTLQAAQGEHYYNLVPFREIRRFLNNVEALGAASVFKNVCGNVLLFMPFGFLLPILFSGVRRFVRTTCAGFFLSLFVEILQLITRLGRFDVDDMILNTLGAAIGFVLFAICIKIQRKQWHQQEGHIKNGRAGSAADRRS